MMAPTHTHAHLQTHLQYMCYVHNVHNAQNPQTHTQLTLCYHKVGHSRHNSPCQSPLWVSKSICVHDHCEVRAQDLFTTLMR